MTLFIALAPPRADATASASYRYAVSPEGRTLSDQGSAALALLPRAVGEVVAVIPAEALSWHQVRLPQLPRNTSGARLRAVLEGLLEEHLLDDPAELHLALQPGRHTGQPAGHAVWVACCDKSWLSSQLQLFEQEGQAIGRLLPATWPHSPGEAPDRVLGGSADAPWLDSCSEQAIWHLPVRSGEEFLAAWTEVQGDDAPAQPAQPRTDDAAETGGDEADAPASAPAPLLHAEPAVVALAEKWYPSAPIQLRSAEQRWLQGYATEYDLAQFDLRLHGHSQRLRRWGKIGNRLLSAPQWRAARVGLLLLLAAQLIGLNSWAWLQQRQLRASEAAVHQTLTQTFPAVRVVVDPPLQMTRELAQLRQAAGHTSPSDLEAMLTALASTLPQTQRLQRLSYSSGSLLFTTTDLSDDDLHDAQGKLDAFGLRLQRDQGDQYALTTTGAR